ncbi:uncharacterized protein [Diadema setosum]|uniref:uncharacterized protein n=1 Tax=Diadema setosum TaxID=31175 RepID=UPI003B3BA9D8
MGDRDFYDILTDVANDVYREEAIEKLGRVLGFQPGKIQSYIMTNMRYGEVTNRGTLQMLRDWHMKAGRTGERSLLRQKLIEAGLRKVADDHLCDAGSSQAQAQTTAQVATSFIVTDRQIMKLSRILPSDKYSDLAVALGFSLNESSAIKTNHQMNNKAATEEILRTWKTEEGGRIDQLDRALVEARCGGLIEQYKQ